MSAVPPVGRRSPAAAAAGSTATTAAAPDRARLEVVRHQWRSVCDLMGATLMRSASSANIKERLDFSCAAFDAGGRLVAQAAHIPVHLGALPAAVAAAATAGPWRPGDAVLLNDPYRGGSHLPDLTIVSPVFAPDGAASAPPAAFLASRAHHADVGGMAAGSLPLAADLFGEGLVVPPVRLVSRGRPVVEVWRIVAANSRTPDARWSDLQAQLAAHRLGAARLAAIERTAPGTLRHVQALLDWSHGLARARWAELPHGTATFTDALDTAAGDPPLAITATVRIDPSGLAVDFTGTAADVAVGLNAPLAVTRSAVLYAACCLLPDVPINDGLLATVRVTAPLGCLVHPRHPAPVAGGNVETSQRIVDAVFGALAALGVPGIPAASQGTMNNLLAGGRDAAGRPWAYYETMSGGGGAAEGRAGVSGLQVHMTNTRNTPIEALESALPIRVERYELRRGSGGAGRWSGGDGVVRRLRFLAPAEITLLTDRRRARPWGLAGGAPGAVGQNRLWRGRRVVPLPGRVTRRVAPGDVIEVRSPGGGGWGPPRDAADGGDDLRRGLGRGRPAGVAAVAGPLAAQPRHDVQDQHERDHPARHAQQQRAIADQDVLGRPAHPPRLHQEQVAQDGVDHERHGE